MVEETFTNNYNQTISDLEELKNKYSCLKVEYYALEESYNNLKKDLESLNNNYNFVNASYLSIRKDYEKAMEYIEKLLLENNQFGEIVKLYLDYKGEY